MGLPSSGWRSRSGGGFSLLLWVRLKDFLLARGTGKSIMRAEVRLTLPKNSSGYSRNHD